MSSIPGDSAPTFRRSLDVLRDGGAAAFGLHAIQAAGLYRKLLVVGGWNAMMPERAQIDLRCGELDRSRIAEYLQLRRDSSQEIIEQRFDRKEACLVAYHQDEIVGACWCATYSAWIDYLEAELHLAEDTVYAYDSWVRPDFRGKRVADGMRRFRMHWIDQSGFKRAFGLIWPQNKNSMQRSRRMSRNEVGEIVRHKVGPWSRLSTRLHGEHADMCRF